MKTKFTAAAAAAFYFGACGMLSNGTFDPFAPRPALADGGKGKSENDSNGNPGGKGKESEGNSIPDGATADAPSRDVLFIATTKNVHQIAKKN